MKKKTKEAKYCKECRHMIEPKNHCICVDVDKKVEETLIRIEKNHSDLIIQMAKNNPDFITIEHFYESGFKYKHEVKKKKITGFVFLNFPIGLFKCRGCGRIISHQQYRFARCCGSCDVGRRQKPPYKIITEFEIPIVKERIDNEIQRLQFNIKDLQRKRRQLK